MKEKKSMGEIKKSLTRGLNAIWNVVKNSFLTPPPDEIKPTMTFIRASGKPEKNPFPGSKSKKS